MILFEFDLDLFDDDGWNVNGNMLDNVVDGFDCFVVWGME